MKLTSKIFIFISIFLSIFWNAIDISFMSWYNICGKINGEIKFNG